MADGAVSVTRASSGCWRWRRAGPGHARDRDGDRDVPCPRQGRALPETGTYPAVDVPETWICPRQGKPFICRLFPPCVYIEPFTPVSSRPRPRLYGATESLAGHAQTLSVVAVGGGALTCPLPSALYMQDADPTPRSAARARLRFASASTPRASRRRPPLDIAADLLDPARRFSAPAGRAPRALGSRRRSGS